MSTKYNYIIWYISIILLYVLLYQHNLVNTFYQNAESICVGIGYITQYTMYNARMIRNKTTDIIASIYVIVIPI